MVEWAERPRRMAGKSVEYVAAMSRVLGMIAPRQPALLDKTPPAQPVRLIEGGAAAPELVMLPSEWDGLDAAAEHEAATRVRDVRLAQLKADGINALYLPGVVVGGRDGAPLDCALHCQPGLKRLSIAFGEPMVFLGEYVAQEGFNATISEQRRRQGEGVFWLYDALPHAAWLTGRPFTVPIEQRLARLRDTLADMDAGLFVGMLDFWLLDAGEMRAKAREVWAAGFEGLVSKRLGSAFERRRSVDWLKVKERFTIACPLVDIAMKDGRLHRVMVRGPAAIGGKPITLGNGWSADDEARIISADRSCHAVDHLHAKVAFSLTTGSPRSVRAPKFKELLA